MNKSYSGMSDLLESRPVGKLAQYLGHALVRLREGKGLNQKQLREAVNRWRTEHYGESVKKVGSGTLSDAENGISNFEIGTIEDAIASIGGDPMELLHGAVIVAVYEREGKVLPPIKRKRRGVQSQEGQNAAASNAAQTGEPWAFPVNDDASDVGAEDDLQPLTPEQLPMTETMTKHRALMHLASSITEDDDAVAAYDAILKAMSARRSIHPGATEEGKT